MNPYSYVFNRPLVLTDPSGFDAEATSVLIYGAGSPEYVATDHAQMVSDEQKTWLMRWPRENGSTTVAVTQSPVAAGAPPPALALADSAEPDVPPLPPAWMEFGAGVAAGSIVGITPFGTMVDPVRNQPALGNHTDDYLFGKAAGEFAGGIALLHAGMGVGAGGSGLVLSGEGSMYGGVAIGAGGVMVSGGVVNAANALIELGVLMMAGGTASDGNSGNQTLPKQVYKAIKEAPKYPHGFRAARNGTVKVKMNNRELLDRLREVEPGEWAKVYKDGWNSSNEKVSIHFFESRSGAVFDVKVKAGWSNPSSN